MLAKELRVLFALLLNPRSVKELSQVIGSTYVRTNQIVNQLIQKGFAYKANGLVKVANTAHASLFKKIIKRYDTEKLLSDSKEDVALALLSAYEIRGILEQTGLSYWTVRRSLNKMMETGAVVERDGVYHLAADEDLKLFLRLWKEEKEKCLVESYAEVVYSSPSLILKKVPEGKIAKGSLTAFSVFSRYGIDMRTVYAYYVQPERKLSIEDVLVHAVVVSTNPVELTDCAVFYVKNKDGMDLGKIREIARKLGVDYLVTDLENYIRNLTISAPERFLPWDEFEEKIRLYGIDPGSLLPPTAYPDFMNQLSRRVRREVKLYLFGGEAMRIKGLKRSTKDVDLVVEDVETFSILKDALNFMDYRELGVEEISVVDRKLNPSGIFIKESFPRMDIFVKSICNTFELSEPMMDRCEIKEIRNIRLCVLSNEDLFLLKSVTDREGDIYDMIQLVKTEGFNWSIVLSELYRQEQKTGKHLCMRLLDSIESVEKRADIRAPFHNQLVNHCIDQTIIDLVRRGKVQTFKQIREYINYPDYRLKNRVKKLIANGSLVRHDEQLVVSPGA